MKDDVMIHLEHAREALMSPFGDETPHHAIGRDLARIEMAIDALRTAPVAPVTVDLSGVRRFNFSDDIPGVIYPDPNGPACWFSDLAHLTAHGAPVVPSVEELAERIEGMCDLWPQTIEENLSDWIAKKLHAHLLAIGGRESREERYRVALEKLAKLGNEPYYGNSEGNVIAREALSPAKGEVPDA